MATKLLASSPTLDGIKAMAGKFLPATALEFVAENGNRWFVLNSRGPITGLMIVKKRGRYRLEMS